MSVRVTIQDETTKIQEYIRKMAPNDDMLGDGLRQQKPNEEMDEEVRPSWKENPVHRMYHRQGEEMSEQALNTRSIEAKVYHTR